jgi:(hydroxyamino)benzene mutase
MNEDNLRRRLAALGALLFALGMVTGIWTAVCLTGKVKVAIPHLALASHLNALLGCFWLLGLSYTVPMLAYGERGRARLAWLSIIPAYGNWLVTLFASVLGARGLEFTGEGANDLVAVLLQVLVVLPTLAASGAWAWGMRRGLARVG